MEVSAHMADLFANMQGATGMADVARKKAWVAPKLVTYGNVEEITLGCNKELGGSDGFTFENQQIMCTS
jgi:hypothetical protein